jgi:hypothetical protein
MNCVNGRREGFAAPEVKDGPSRLAVDKYLAFAAKGSIIPAV